MDRKSLCWDPRGESRDICSPERYLLGWVSAELHEIVIWIYRYPRRNHGRFGSIAHQYQRWESSGSSYVGIQSFHQFVWKTPMAIYRTPSRYFGSRYRQAVWFAWLWGRLQLPGPVNGRRVKLDHCHRLCCKTRVRGGTCFEVRKGFEDRGGRGEAEDTGADINRG